MNTGRTHFKKGFSPWNKGELILKVCQTCKKEYRVHPYRAEKSKNCSRECRKKPRQCMLCLGVFYRHGDKGRKYCSSGCSYKSMKGKKPKNFGKEFLYKGKDNFNWKGGITPEIIMIRTSVEMRLWREAVFARDNFTCQQCGLRGCELNADHIKPFALYPELRFAIDNGRTLCIPCHRKTPTYGGRIRSKNIIQ